MKTENNILNKMNYSIILVLCLVLSFGLVLSKIQIALADLEYTDNPIGFDAEKRVPYSDPDLGVGAEVGTNENNIVPIENMTDQTDSGLVRVSVMNPDSDIKLFSAGSDILQIPKGHSCSTTFLASFKKGGVNLYSNKPTNARVEVIASFQAVDRPGSVHALEKAVLRADSKQDLSGKNIGTTDSFVGVVGQGGVPSEDVRAVFYTATIATTVAHTTFEISGNKIDIPEKGITHISSLAIPDENGNLPVAVYRGSERAKTSADLSLYVRGYIEEGNQQSSGVNFSGSIVPKIDRNEITLDIKENEEQQFDIPSAPKDSEYSLLMVSANNIDTDRDTTIDFGTNLIKREQGILVNSHDDDVYPQLVLVKTSDQKSNIILHHGSARVKIWHVADILAPVSNSVDKLINKKKNNNLSLSIDSPNENQKIDILKEKQVKLSGEIDSGDFALAKVDVRVSDNEGAIDLGSAKIRYQEDKIKWEISNVPDVSGYYTFTVTAIDRIGNKIVQNRLLEVETYDPETTEIVDWPTTVQIDDLSKYKEIGDDYVDMKCDQNVGPGSVIRSWASSDLPSGLLVKVISVDKIGNICRYRTQKADMSDAVQHLHMKREVNVGDILTNSQMKTLVGKNMKDENGDDIKGTKILNAEITTKDKVDEMLAKKDASQVLIDSDKPIVAYCDEDGNPLDNNQDCSLAAKSTEAPNAENDSKQESKDKSVEDTSDNPEPMSNSPNKNIENEDNGESDIDKNNNNDKIEESDPLRDYTAGESRYIINDKRHNKPNLKEIKFLENRTGGNQEKRKTETKIIHTKTEVAYTGGITIDPKQIAKGWKNPKKRFDDLRKGILKFVNGANSNNLEDDSDNNEMEDLDDDELEGFDDDEDGQNQEKGKGSPLSITITIKGAVRIVTDTYEEITAESYSDLGYHHKVKWYNPATWFPDLETEHKQTNITTTDDIMDFSGTLTLTLKWNIVQMITGNDKIIIQITGTPITVEISIKFVLKIEIEAEFYTEKITRKVKEKGEKTHNFSKEKIDNEHSETLKDTSQFLKFTVNIKIGFEVTADIAVLGIIKFGVTIEIGIYLKGGVDSFIPVGSRNFKLKGTQETGFYFKCSLHFVIDVVIFKINFNFPVANIEKPFYNWTYTGKMPKRNIGEAIFDIGVTSDPNDSVENRSFNIFRDHSVAPNTIWMLTREVNGRFVPQPIAQFQKDSIDIFDITESDETKSKDWKIEEYKDKCENLTGTHGTFKFEGNPIIADFSSDQCEKFLGKFKTSTLDKTFLPDMDLSKLSKTTGSDGVGWLRDGDSLAEYIDVGTGKFTNLMTEDLYNNILANLDVNSEDQSFLS
ncbi:MAG: hypothetical protein LBM13_04745, partial [Candidatus Ancillula sp.]|nr:hypothetical protein [Candidatus Ancillula sp.]